MVSVIISPWGNSLHFCGILGGVNTKLGVGKSGLPRFLVDISSDGFIYQLGTGVLTFMIQENEGIAQKQEMELP